MTATNHILERGSKLLEDKPKSLFPYVGSKNQILKKLVENIPVKFKKYIEPFAGSACLGLSLLHNHTILSDNNEDLINCYKQIKQCPDEVINDLKNHLNEETYYYNLRDLDPTNLSLAQRASRIIYLYSCCYHGLIRYNQKGFFNSPFGFRKNPSYLNFKNILAVSRYLNDSKVILRCCDFEEVLKDCATGDLVYCDPPYDFVKKDSHTAYTKIDFKRFDQERLASCARELNSRGVFFIISNSDTDFIRNLYRGFEIQEIKVNQKINYRIGNCGGTRKEVLITNYREEDELLIQ